VLLLKTQFEEKNLAPRTGFQYFVVKIAEDGLLFWATPYSSATY